MTDVRTMHLAAVVVAREVPAARRSRVIVLSRPGDCRAVDRDDALRELRESHPSVARAVEAASVDEHEVCAVIFWKKPRAPEVVVLDARNPWREGRT